MALDRHPVNGLLLNFVVVIEKTWQILEKATVFATVNTEKGQ